MLAVSGEVPEQPVVSTKSGHVFEKRLIERYVSVWFWLSRVYVLRSVSFVPFFVAERHVNVEGK